EDEAVLPAREVADNFEIGAAWDDAGGVLRGEGAREFPEHAVHRHEQIGFTDVANAGPFGIPAVRAIVAVAGFRQTEGLPFPPVEQHEDERFRIPADAPDGIGLRMFATGNAAGAGDLRELVAPHELPVLPGLAPFGEGAAGNRRVSERGL